MRVLVTGSSGLIGSELVTFFDARAEAVVDIAEAETLEHWRIRLENRGDRARVIELTSYQELAIAGWDGYRRTPAYNAIHVGTCFVRALGAIIARNRHLKPAPVAGYPFAREVAFHAAAGAEGSEVRLVGYQDARPCFIGTGTLAAPAKASKKSAPTKAAPKKAASKKAAGKAAPKKGAAKKAKKAAKAAPKKTAIKPAAKKAAAKKAVSAKAAPAKKPAPARPAPKKATGKGDGAPRAKAPAKATAKAKKVVASPPSGATA